ncbi:N-acyl homoserine lactonase family protein [Bradyrhizobium sp. AS23.2]|uniref:N-acyl homoserine lactonase family protein n=1 Tax=Bradyrhizobium sp. AS23.2 TaxID=1680155 RepID=UPI00093EE4F1|nr:N-acyl homoserine lactonase family protein [Bradyrhizobium sp. AS23.2]
MTIKQIALSLAIALGLASAAAAQEGPKLYVFTSGSLGGFPKAALQMGGQGNIDWAPVSFYVLKHPKGNVIIDTGNNDKTITDPDGWWGPLAKGFGLKMTKDDAIPAQLEKIGLKTDDIKYVVVGHLHLDHGGNVSQFPNATLVAQNDELKAAWWPDVGYSLYYIPGDFADTKKMNIIRLEGDLDLFDDGSVRVMRAPGHTPRQPVRDRQIAQDGYRYSDQRRGLSEREPRQEPDSADSGHVQSERCLSQLPARSAGSRRQQCPDLLRARSGGFQGHQARARVL